MRFSGNIFWPIKFSVYGFGQILGINSGEFDLLLWVSGDWGWTVKSSSLILMIFLLQTVQFLNGKYNQVFACFCWHEKKIRCIVCRWTTLISEAIMLSQTMGQGDERQWLFHLRSFYHFSIKLQLHRQAPFERWTYRFSGRIRTIVSWV